MMQAHAHTHARTHTHTHTGEKSDSMMLINSGFVHCVLYTAEDGQVVQELDTGSYFGEINCFPAVLRGLIDARVTVAGIYLYLYLSIHLSIDRSIDPSIDLSINQSIYAPEPDGRDACLCRV